MKYLIKTCLLAGLLISGSAFAQSRGGGAASGRGPVYFEETFFPVYVQRNDTGSVTDAPGVATESGLGYDFRTTLGYVFWDQALLGLTYNMYSLTTKRAAITGGDYALSEKTDKNQFGLSLGWLNGGFRAVFTYFFSGSQQVRTTHSDETGAVQDDVMFKNTGISGFQFAAGYTFNLFSNVEIGPTLIYRSITYKTQSKTNYMNSSPAENYSGTPLYSKKVDSSLDPMISVVVRF